jgi:hypothetical protein
MKSKSLRDPGDTSESAQASVIRGLGWARAAVNEIIEGPDAMSTRSFAPRTRTAE